MKHKIKHWLFTFMSSIACEALILVLLASLRNCSTLTCACWTKDIWGINGELKVGKIEFEK